MKRLIKLCAVSLVACLVLTIAQSSVTAQDQLASSAAIPELFGSDIRLEKFHIAADPTVVRNRTVRVNFDLLNSLVVNDRFIFNLFEDVAFTAHLENIKNSNTWIGSIEGKPAGTFILVMNDGAMSAIIRVPGKGIYRVRSLRDGVVVIQEIDETRFPPCGVGPDDGVPAGGGAAAGAGADCDDGSVIDVLVVYTPLARSAAGGTAAIETEIDLAIAVSNNIYGNSLIGTELNLAHVEEVSYNEAGTYAQHLNRLTNPTDGFMDNVHNLRDQYGADMVSLLVADDNFCGIAWLMQELSPDFEQFAFSVTTWSCAVGNLSFPHELGHNMGCCHAIGDGNGCYNGALFPYSNGHRFNGNSGQLWRTVMAYQPGFRIHYYSNPGAIYDGQPIGIVPGQPGAADNALTIQQTVLTISNFRCYAGFVETDKLTANDGAEDDRFGQSVAISGTTVIIGAYQDDDNGSASGSAYLFDTSTGMQWFKLLPDDGTEYAGFGNSVAISGAIAIVGAFQDGDLCLPDDPFCVESGSAYLFNTAMGQQTAKLIADDASQGDQFGISVAISGTTAIVGARNDDSSYLFDISDPVNPVQITKLLPNDGASGDFFGNSVAISGETVIVGSPRHDDNGSNSGAAYLFDVSVPANPIQIAKLMASDGAAYDQFGTAVSISGATAIIGAIADDDNGNYSGSAYLFDTTTGLQIAKLLPDDGAAIDQFGTSVAISGAYAIVGAIRHDDNGSESGSAYLFDISNPSNPLQISKLLPDGGAAGDQFGNSVAINGITAIIGAFLDNDNGPSSGSAYVFEGTGDPGVPGDLDGDGSVSTNDLLILFANWGLCVDCNNCPADLDGDCSVSTSDLLILFENWG